MPYSLSFSKDFFYGDENTKHDRNFPTNVMDAILAIDDTVWDEMAKEVFGVSGDRLDPDMVMEKIISTDTCSNLDSPVEVWIDEDGDYFVYVYEEVPKGRHAVKLHSGETEYVDDEDLDAANEIFDRSRNPRLRLDLDVDFEDEDFEDDGEEYSSPSIKESRRSYESPSRTERAFFDNPSRSTVSIWFDKDRFTRSKARKWLSKHKNFRTSGGYDSDGFYAFPQMSERTERKYRGKIRSKYIAPGILLKFVPVRYMKKRR